MAYINSRATIKTKQGEINKRTTPSSWGQGERDLVKSKGRARRRQTAKGTKETKETKREGEKKKMRGNMDTKTKGG